MDRNTALLIALLLAFATARADQHIYEPTTFESGSSLSITSGVVLDGTWDFSGATVLGLGGAGGSVTSVFTRIGAVVAQSGDYSAFYQPLDADLTGWAAKTPYAGNLTITSGQTLNVTSGGTLGSAAYTASSAYEVPLTFSQSLSRATNTVTLNGDTASPGNSKYYGTDTGGARGWFALPAVGGGGTVTNITTTAPIQGGPITTTGAINLDPTKVTAWDLANTDRLKWDGGATGLNPANGRGSLGASQIGESIFTMPVPISATAWIKITSGGAAIKEDAATTRNSLGLDSAAQQPITAFEVPLSFVNSLNRNISNFVQLQGDSGTPGNSKYYGTDGSGTRGYYSLPAGGGTGDVTGPGSSTDNQIAIFSGTTGKAIKAASGSGLAKISAGVLGTTADNSANWDTAYSERAQWDGGSTGLTPVNGRTSLGATSTGSAIFTITPPGVISWVRLTALGGAVTENATTTRTSLGLGTAALNNTGDFEVPLSFNNSVRRTGNTVALDNDASVPGSSKYYGTDGSGTRGYFALSSLGGGDFSSNTSTSVANELVLFADTTGKIGKRPGSVSGLALLTNGVLGAVANGSNNWDTAYNDRLKWDPSLGLTGGTAAQARTALGASTTGGAILTTTGPGATSWIKASPLGTIAYEDAGTTRTSLGLVIGTNVQAWSAALDTWATTTNNASNWNTGFTERRQWDGSNTNLTAATGRASLGIGDAAVYENAAIGTTALAATDVYLSGSNIVIPAGAWALGGQYHCSLSILKSAATGVATPIFTLRVGTAGTISDAAVVTVTFTAPTAAANELVYIDIYATIKGGGATGSAVIGGKAQKNLFTTTGFCGLQNASTTTSGAFNFTTGTTMGLSFNGGTSFTGTAELVQAEYKQ